MRGGFISAIILAAGRGTRMGGGKLLLPLGDRTIIAKVADEVLASEVDEVIAVLGHRAGDVAAALGCTRSLRVVVNDDYRAGQSTSLIAGVRAVDPRATALIVVLGDQPLLTSGLIDRLIGIYRGSGYKVARPVFRGRPGHPVLMDISFIPALLELKGDLGAREVLAPFAHQTTLMDVDDPALLLDVDTAEDYKRVLGLSRRL